MKIYIIATEASGDYLGSHLIKELKKKRINSIEGIGGELMKMEGMRSWVSIEEFNTIGLIEVLIRIPKFYKIFKKVENLIKNNPPDILITIDSPSFSYRLVKKIQSLRKKVIMIHYVAPTVWAWKKYRAKIFANLYDKLFVLFKFEKKYFVEHKLKTFWVGHQIFFNKTNIKKEKTICFLPGSREIEIKKNLKKMKDVINDISSEYSNYKFYILGFDHHKKIINQIIPNSKVKIITNFDLKQKIMMQSSLALASSGSVTLELSKYRTPMVVVYDTNYFTRILIKLFVKVKFCSLINIFFNKEVVPELIFEKFTYSRVINEIRNLLNNERLRKRQRKHMNIFSEKMLNKGNPAKLVVEHIFKK
tara:strand:- start:260 stop:1345 length:1086 start_codon:yes stop_codon:yes gene_type:complete